MDRESVTPSRRPWQQSVALHTLLTWSDEPPPQPLGPLVTSCSIPARSRPQLDTRRTAARGLSASGR